MSTRHAYVLLLSLTNAACAPSPAPCDTARRSACDAQVPNSEALCYEAPRVNPFFYGCEPGRLTDAGAPDTSDGSQMSDWWCCLTETDAGEQ